MRMVNTNITDFVLSAIVTVTFFIMCVTRLESERKVY